MSSFSSVLICDSAALSSFWTTSARVAAVSIAWAAAFISRLAFHMSRMRARSARLGATFASPEAMTFHLERSASGIAASSDIHSVTSPLIANDTTTALISASSLAFSTCASNSFVCASITRPGIGVSTEAEAFSSESVSLVAAFPPLRSRATLLSQKPTLAFAPPPSVAPFSSAATLCSYGLNVSLKEIDARSPTLCLNAYSHACGPPRPTSGGAGTSVVVGGSRWTIRWRTLLGMPGAASRGSAPPLRSARASAALEMPRRSSGAGANPAGAASVAGSATVFSRTSCCPCATARVSPIVGPR